MASELNIGKTLADGGTQLLPSLTFSADPNTGVYNADINELGFTTNGSEKMRINNAGDVGIGGSPVGKLSVKGVTATDEGSHITFENTQGAKVFAVGGGKDGVSNNGFCVVNVTDDTAPLTISDAGVVSIPGNLGVGGTPNYNFESFASNAYAYLAASAWSATNTHQPMVMLRKAASNTINAASGIATENGESLGAVMWEAPNTGNGWRETAGIAVIEDGANTSTRPPSKMEFSTSDGSTRSTRLSISSAGLVTASNGIAVTNSNNYGVVEGNASTLDLADDAQIQVADTIAGAMLLHIYEGGYGHGGLIFVTYNGAPVVLADPANVFSNADTDAKICVYKSATSHDVFLKNRLGATRSFRVLITAGNIDS